MKKLIVFGGVVILLIIAYNLFTFTVDETQKAAVLRFGEIVKVVEDPGLHFKVPFINNVVYLEDRILNYDIQPRDILTSCLLYTSPSPRDGLLSRMPSSA